MKPEWRTELLGNIVTVVNGGTPKSKVARYWGGDVQWLTPKEMGQMDGRYISNTVRTISEDGLSESSARLVPPESVILSTRAPIGHLAINETPMAFNQGCRGLVPSDQIDTEYLYYFLLLSRPKLNELGTGTTFKELSATRLKSVNVPLPPLEEQRRIVAVLDEAFEGLDRARKNTETNLTNARELFESYLKIHFESSPQSWIKSKLKDVCYKIGSGATPKGGAASYKDEGISLIRSMNVHNRRFKPNKLAFIDEDQASKLKNVVVEAQDVLFNITGASVARCCVAPEKILPARVNQHVSILRPDKSTLNPEFLCLLLTSEKMKKSLLQIGDEGGSTRQAITKKQLEQLEVVYPADINEQHMIVREFQELERNCNAVADANESKLTSLMDLRQSILQKAFAGELTASTQYSVATPANDNTSPDFAASVLAYAYNAHAAEEQQNTFGHVKAQKVLHLVEAMAGIDMGREPFKDRAGPNDMAHMRRAEDWAREEKLFYFEERPKGYTFIRMGDFDRGLRRAEEQLEAIAPVLEHILGVLVPMNSKQAEAVATTYAAWNNFIIDGIEPTDAQIARAASVEWHTDKKLTEAECLTALAVLRREELIPDGSAKYVGKQRNLL